LAGAFLAGAFATVFFAGAFMPCLLGATVAERR
jgi:hypothetical protein